MQRQPDGLGLLHEKFAADAVHADAVVGFCDGGQQRGDADVRTACISMCSAMAESLPPDQQRG